MVKKLLLATTAFLSTLLSYSFEVNEIPPLNKKTEISVQHKSNAFSKKDFLLEDTIKSSVNLNVEEWKKRYEQNKYDMKNRVGLKYAKNIKQGNIYEAKKIIEEQIQDIKETYNDEYRNTYFYANFLKAYENDIQKRLKKQRDHYSNTLKNKKTFKKTLKEILNETGIQQLFREPTTTEILKAKEKITKTKAFLEHEPQFKKDFVTTWDSTITAMIHDDSIPENIKKYANKNNFFKRQIEIRIKAGDLLEAYDIVENTLKYASIVPVKTDTSLINRYKNMIESQLFNQLKEMTKDSVDNIIKEDNIKKLFNIKQLRTDSAREEGFYNYQGKILVVYTYDPKKFPKELRNIYLGQQSNQRPGLGKIKHEALKKLSNYAHEVQGKLPDKGEYYDIMLGRYEYVPYLTKEGKQSSYYTIKTESGSMTGEYQISLLVNEIKNQSFTEMIREEYLKVVTFDDDYLGRKYAKEKENEIIQYFETASNHTLSIQRNDSLIILQATGNNSIEDEKINTGRREETIDKITITELKKGKQKSYYKNQQKSKELFERFNEEYTTRRKEIHEKLHK